MVYVVVTMRIARGRMEEFLKACEEVRPLVLGEKGCLGYDHTREVRSPLASQEAMDPHRITLIERWESMEDLEAHTRAPHVAAFGARVREMRESVSARVTETIF